MTTSPVNNSVVTADDLARNHFGANFAPHQVERVIWEATNLQNATGPASLQNYDEQSNAEIASSQMAGITLATGKDINFLWRLPNDIDVTKEVAFNLLCSNSEAVDATKYCTFVTLVKAFIVGTTAIAIPATAVTSEMSTIANVGANVLQQATTWAKLAGATFAAMGLTRGKDCLGLMFTGTFTGSADITVYKILSRFYVRQVSGGV